MNVYYSAAQFWFSVVGALYGGWLLHWVWVRVDATMNLAHRERVEAEAARILAGFRRYAITFRERNPFHIFGRPSVGEYIPRHSAEDRDPAALRALTESTASVPTILPQRVPGASLELEPLPPLPVAEVFSDDPQPVAA